MTDRRDLNLFSRERQVVLGTMLGGSSCVRYGRATHHLLSMRGRDEGWLAYKAQELARLASDGPVTQEANGYLRWHSYSLPCLDAVRTLFYGPSSERVIHPDVWDSLCDIGWAVWLGDCGEVLPEGIRLRVGVHGVSSRDCRSYFEEMGLECQLSGKGRAARLAFDVESSYGFLKVCRHQIPRFMLSRYTEALGGKDA